MSISDLGAGPARAGVGQLVLTHRGLPDDAVADHSGGWDHYLERLAAVVNGEDPGPDVAQDAA